jgi:hypothetical protein
LNEPSYNKPEEPGIAMNFDNTVSIYQIVGPEDSFEQAASTSFSLLREAQEKYPDWPRVFYLDIEGHKGPQSGFSEEFFEFQQEFWFQTIAHFVTAFETPMVGALINPNPQQNNVPDALRVDPPIGDSE